MQDDAEQDSPLRCVCRWVFRVLTVLLLLVAGLAAWWAWPKWEPPRGDGGEAGYMGFGLPRANNMLFGKRYIGIRYRSNQLSGYASFSRPGFNDFSIRYANGQLMQEGRWFVRQQNSQQPPSPDPSHTEWARCYKPDGSLGSEVVNGNGTCTVWTSKGVKEREIVFEAGRAVRTSGFHGNGKPRYVYVTEPANRALVHSITFARDGTKEHETDHRTHKTRYYRPDGTIEKIEEPLAGPPPGIMRKRTYYRRDGTVDRVEEFAVGDGR